MEEQQQMSINAYEELTWLKNEENGTSFRIEFLAEMKISRLCGKKKNGDTHSVVNKKHLCRLVSFFLFFFSFFNGNSPKNNCSDNYDRQHNVNNNIAC